MILTITIISIAILGIITEAIINIFNLQDEAHLIKMKKETDEKHQKTKQIEITK